MSEKRFTYDSKSVSIMKDGDFWLDGNVDTACNNNEICSELNGLVDENEQLKKQIQRLELKLQRERCATQKQHLKWSEQAETRIKELEKENESLRFTQYIIRSDV